VSRSGITDAERFNAAANSNPELGFPSLSLDDYIWMTKRFAQMAGTLDRSSLTADEEIDRALEAIGE
jgi:hypothetical protein